MLVFIAQGHALRDQSLSANISQHFKKRGEEIRRHKHKDFMNLLQRQQLPEKDIYNTFDVARIQTNPPQQINTLIKRKLRTS